MGSHTREYCLSKPFVLGKEADCCPNCFCCLLQQGLTVAMAEASTAD